MTRASKPIAVIGAGSIGTGWAIAFAAAGFAVRLQDTDPARLDAARAEADRSGSAILQSYGLLAEPVAEVAARIAVGELAGGRGRGSRPHPGMRAGAAGAEAAPVRPAGCAGARRLPDRELLLVHAGLAASPPICPARSRCLVVHPGNPPYLLRVAEVVPAPFTSAATVERTEALLRRAGIVPVRVGREVEGFVFNRLQGALLREAYCLVRDGVATVADIDLVVRDGLGLRWAAIGPFETADLNTRGGIAAHA